MRFIKCITMCLNIFGYTQTMNKYIPNRVSSVAGRKFECHKIVSYKILYIYPKVKDIKASISIISRTLMA